MLELLGLVLPILRQFDPALHAHIEAAGMQAHFALSWFITWFSYNLTELQDAARLFDLFLASHPIMPIYAAVAILVVHPSACCDNSHDLTGASRGCSSVLQNSIALPICKRYESVMNNEEYSEVRASSMHRQSLKLHLQASRERILECELDYGEMHHLLTNLPPLGALSPEKLVSRAAAIYQQCQPKRLLRMRHVRPLK